jgi:hypothetical protein
MSEAEVSRDEALRVLRVAVEEARVEPGTHVSRARVMEQTKITNEDHKFGRVLEDSSLPRRAGTDSRRGKRL